MAMKRFFFSLTVMLLAITVGAQTPKDVKYVFTEASDLSTDELHETSPQDS